MKKCWEKRELKYYFMKEMIIFYCYVFGSGEWILKDFWLLRVLIYFFNNDKELNKLYGNL